MQHFAYTMASVFTLKILHPVKAYFAIPCKMFSLSSSSLIEGFIDREFSRAQKDMNTESMDDPGALLQKLGREQKWRLQAAKKARMARLFQSPREPRRLTWEAIEQIRYLKQESDQKWTTEMLAESFSVSKDIIIKILKSKFVPSGKSRMKQDMVANLNVGLLPEKVTSSKVEGRNKKILHPSFSVKTTSLLDKTDDLSERGEIIEAHRKNLAKRPFQRRHTSQRYLDTQEQLHANNKLPEKNMKTCSRKQKTNPKQTVHQKSGSFEHSHTMDRSISYKKSPGKITGERGHYYYGAQSEDAEIFRGDVDKVAETGEELDIDMDNLESYDDGSPPPAVIQRGKEFFDEQGNFLYSL